MAFEACAYAGMEAAEDLRSLDQDSVRLRTAVTGDPVGEATSPEIPVVPTPISAISEVLLHVSISGRHPRRKGWADVLYIAVNLRIFHRLAHEGTASKRAGLLDVENPALIDIAALYLRTPRIRPDPAAPRT